MEMTMTFDDQWLENKITEIQGMQTEIEKRIEQLKQQQFMTFCRKKLEVFLLPKLCEVENFHFTSVPSKFVGLTYFDSSLARP